MSMLTGSQLLQPVNFTLNGSALALPPESFDGPGTGKCGAGDVGDAAIRVTSWAFTIVRRSKSADGESSPT